MKSGEELPIFIHWMEFTKWLLKTTEKFPKRIRFTITQRIENLTLDVFQSLVKARYRKDRGAIFNEINLSLEQLRLLLRLSYEMEYCGQKQYEYAIRQVDEAGRMVGGWKKQQVIQ